MKWLAAAAAAAALLALIAIALLDSRVRTLTADKAGLEREVETLTASRARQADRADTCEARRDTEQTRCVEILDDFDARCDTRVREAAQAACAIRETSYACPSFDENMCPRRDRVDAGELRRATGARGPG